MVITTRSKSKMVIDDEIKEYFTSLLQPLAKEEKILEMMEVLNQLTTSLKAQAEKIEKLEATVAVQENVIENLTISCDNNEQYSRRNCLRLNGVEIVDNEDQSVIFNKIEKCYNDVGINFDPSSIDRAHRIGKPFRDKNGKKRPIIYN